MLLLFVLLDAMIRKKLLHLLLFLNLDHALEEAWFDFSPQLCLEIETPHIVENMRGAVGRSAGIAAEDEDLIQFVDVTRAVTLSSTRNKIIIIILSVIIISCRLLLLLLFDLCRAFDFVPDCNE